MDKKLLTTPQELRDWVQKRLGRNVPEHIWNLHDEENRVNQTLEDIIDCNAHEAETVLEDFIGAIAHDLKVWRNEPEKGLHSSRREEDLELSGSALSEYEGERALALAEYHAKFASAQREVRDFREEILEGKLLSPAEADPFVNSAAICFANQFTFSRYSIPITMHSATLLEEKRVIEQGKLYQTISFLLNRVGSAEEHTLRINFPCRTYKMVGLDQ